MAEPLRFRVHMIGFGDVPGVEPSPSGIILEVEWQTRPATVSRVPLSREDFDTYGTVLVGAMESQDVYWLRLDGPESSPLPALLRAVKEGQVYYP